MLRFARKVAFNEGTVEADFEALRSHGIDDVGIRNCLYGNVGIRHGAACCRRGPFENGDEVRDNLPSKFYGENVNQAPSPR